MASSSVQPSSFPDLNAIRHDNMRATLEKISWIIELVKDRKVVSRQAGFAVDNHLIMSSASLFRNIKKKELVKARMLGDNVGVVVEQVFIMAKWDIIIFRLPKNVKYEIGNFVSDGTLIVNQTVLHMGHSMLGTYHVGHVCSPVKNVILPLFGFSATCENYIPSETIRYPIMGHFWNSEVYTDHQKKHGFKLDFGRDFSPHVPIIKMNGFSASAEDLGGPIINTSGKIVGMFAGDGTLCIGIHVTALQEVLANVN